MSLSEKEIEDNAICRVCRGRGQSEVQETVDDIIETTYKFCEACGGTGLEDGDGYVD